MTDSYRKIDYRLRPAKAVERRMIAEYFLRLRAFGKVEDYRYVGLGSVYFSDFALYHNVCGFNSMVSIEGVEDVTIKKRFEFNAPFGSIDLQFGMTGTVLPKLSWEQKTAVWLDFDGVLDNSILTDIEFLGAKLSPFSIFLVSVNGELRDLDQGKLSRMDVLVSRVGAAKIPAPYQGKNNISAGEVASVYRQILNNELQNAITKRNSGRELSEFIQAEQVAFFKYADGVAMYTIGWVFFMEKDREKFKDCSYDSLPHFRNEGEPFFIDVPLITNSEINALNRCKVEYDKLQTKGLPIPDSEIKKYLSLKRFWPVLQIPDMT